jgi:hypothetical protein
MNTPHWDCRQCGRREWELLKEYPEFKTVAWRCRCGLFTHVAEGDMICDVCGEQPVIACQRTLPYEATVLGTAILPRERLWATCATCLPIMTAGDVDALLERGVRTVIRQLGRNQRLSEMSHNPLVIARIREELRPAWATMMAHRDGPPFELRSN